MALLASVTIHVAGLALLPGLPDSGLRVDRVLEVILPGREPVPEETMRATVRPSTRAAPFPHPASRPQIARNIERSWAADQDELQVLTVAPTPTQEPSTQPATAVVAAAPIEPAPTPAAVNNAILDGYGHTVAEIVARQQRYPKVARLRQWQGTAVIQVQLGEAGNARSVRVVSSSGHEVLDQQAVDMVRAALPLPAPPASLAGTAFTIDVPIVFRLTS